MPNPLEINPNTHEINHSQVIPVRDNHLITPTQLVPFNSASSSASASNNSGKSPKKLIIPAMIEQTERLFTTRSRSVNHLDGGGDRGEHAYIKILTTDPNNSLKRTQDDNSLGTTTSGVLLDAVKNSAKYLGYANFILTDVRCNLDEKLQIVEVFGDAEVSYYFGRQPIQFDFSGVLIDSVDNNWFIEWFDMYVNVLRGTQLARNYELVKIVLPNMEIIGHINRTSWNQNSARDTDIPFQFSFLAKEIRPKPVVLPSKPLTNDPVINWDKGAGFLTQAQVNTKKSNAEQLRSVVADPTSTNKSYADAMANFKSEQVNTTSSWMGGEIGSNNLASISNVSPTLSGGTGGAGGGVSTSSTALFSNLSGVRASMFSPVYGVLSSLTKLIKTNTGSLNSVVSSFTNPVRDILRDIKSVSHQAIGVVNLVNNSIHGITNEINTLDRDLFTTLSLLKKTAGVITTAPQSISSSVSALVRSGRLPLSSNFLQNRHFNPTLPGGHSPNKAALLNSGKKHTAESGAKI